VLDIFYRSGYDPAIYPLTFFSFHSELKLSLITLFLSLFAILSCNLHLLTRKGLQLPVVHFKQVAKQAKVLEKVEVWQKSERVKNHCLV
jgi:hypothetical protein